jgi:hypothetical protein
VSFPKFTGASGDRAQNARRKTLAADER